MSLVCAVMRMISAVTGEQQFLDGISAYLKRYSYGSTSGDDRKCWLPKSDSK